MTLADISNCWIMWNKCVLWSHQYPNNPAFQRQAARAQMQLVCAMAQYWVAVKPA